MNRILLLVLVAFTAFGAEPEVGFGGIEEPKQLPFDEPPRVAFEPKVKYPDAAKRARVQGVVRLKLAIDVEGRVVSAKVLDGPGHGLDVAALDASKGLLFTPASRNGEAVPVPAMIYRYAFKL